MRKENELATVVIGEAIQIHQTLGPGLLESVYETCLAHKLIVLGLNIKVQKPIPVVFDNIKLECGFRCDILVENKLIIEIKACEALNDIHFAQLLTYLKLSDIRLGLLINFNVLKLKDGIRRVANNL
jgi:GxxExxY protein